jgi:hypothetical protein
MNRPRPTAGAAAALGFWLAALSADAGGGPTRQRSRLARLPDPTQRRELFHAPPTLGPTRVDARANRRAVAAGAACALSGFVPAGHAADRIETLRFFSKDVSITLTKTDGTV